MINWDLISISHDPVATILTWYLLDYQYILNMAVIYENMDWKQAFYLYFLQMQYT